MDGAGVRRAGGGGGGAQKQGGAFVMAQARAPFRKDRRESFEMRLEAIRVALLVTIIAAGAVDLRFYVCQRETRDL